MDGIKWEWIGSFVKVVDAGSTRLAASRQVSQATLSRHINALEEHLGYALFDRSARGMTLTPMGAQIFERAAALCHAQEDFLAQARGALGNLDGTVRIAISGWLAMSSIHDWLVTFHKHHPTICVNLLIQNANTNLVQREADVVLSTLPRDDLDVASRRVGSLALGFYASRDYIARRGLPTMATYREHDLVGWDKDALFIRTARRFGVRLTPEDFVLRCDDSNVLYHAVERGVGVGVIWKPLADRSAELVEVISGFTLPSPPLFLVCRADYRTIPRLSTTVASLFTFFQNELAPPARTTE
ncbi:MAG: LysR family transcriptional regulator [Myxococcota bacterium]